MLISSSYVATQSLFKNDLYLKLLCFEELRIMCFIIYFKLIKTKIITKCLLITQLIKF